MTMSATAGIEDEEEFFSADEATASPIPPRETCQTPLTSEVMEEIASITSKLVKFKEKKNPEIEDALQLFIEEWRHQTKQEIEDLVKLKDRVTVRKAQRAEEEARFAEMMREEEESRIRMVEEERVRKQEEKLKRLQDAELKRQKMIEEKNKGRNFTIVSTGREQRNEQQNISRELTKEEYDVMKEAALSVIIKPLDIGGLRKERLKRRTKELWDRVVELETERYDIEEKRTRQEYDLKELKERQKQQLRAKALKLGLSPEALTGRYPPKIRVASKYERRKGLRPFGETKDLFEGGMLEEYHQRIEDTWMDRQEVFTKRNTEELPPWLADMPRQILKQLLEEEEAIKAAILKEEMEAKQRAEEEAAAAAAAAAEEEAAAAAAAEEEAAAAAAAEEAANEEEKDEEEGVEEEEQEVAESEAPDEAEEVESVAATDEVDAEEAESVAATDEVEADEVESVAATDEVESVAATDEAEETAPSAAQEEEVEADEEEEEAVDVAPQEEEDEGDEV